MAQYSLTLIYMGYFDYLFYMEGGGGGGGKTSNSGICFPIVIKLGIIIL